MQRFEAQPSSKNRGTLVTTIFEMQEWNSCDTHTTEWAIGILYSLTWSQIDVKKEIEITKIDE